MLALTDLICTDRLRRSHGHRSRIVDRLPWERGTPSEPRRASSPLPFDSLSRRHSMAGGRTARAVPHDPTPSPIPRHARTIVLDYGDRIRCSLVLNPPHQRTRATRVVDAERSEGTRRRRADARVNLDIQPARRTRWTCHSMDRGSAWRSADRGSRKPSKDRCRTCSGSRPAKTRRCSPRRRRDQDDGAVEACYTSSETGATPIPPV